MKTYLEPTRHMTTRQRVIGWLRFLTMFIGLMVTVSAGQQVYEHWAVANNNPISYGLSSFITHLIPRLLHGIEVAVASLLAALWFRIDLPWTKSTEPAQSSETNAEVAATSQ